MADVFEKKEASGSEKNKKKMSKGKRAALIVFCVMLVIVLAVVIFLVVPNWGNIKALYLWQTQSSDRLQENISNAKNVQSEAISQVLPAEKAEVDKAIDAINGGEINPDQLQQILLGNLTVDQAKNENKPADENNVSAEDKPSDTQPEIIDPNPEATLARDEGKITEGQYTQVVIGNMSLEQAIEDSANPEQAEKQKDEKIEEVQTNNNVEVEEAVKEAYKKDEISIDQVDKITTEDLTLEQAIEDNKNAVITQTTPQKAPPKENESSKDETKNDTASKPDGEADKNAVADETNQSKPEQTKPEQSKPAGNNTSATTQSVDERIAGLVTQLYVLKSQYEGTVMGFINQMKAEYVQIPYAQRTRSHKSSIASKYVSRINAAEAQCDAQVNAIVSEVRQLLKDNGRDTSLADALLSTYATEKENTKAYCLSQYGD